MEFGKYKFWRLPIFSDKRGNLCAVEFSQLPFKPKRAYFLYGNKAQRGGHAHRNEQEVFVCAAGSFRATVHDGKKGKQFMMSKPGSALYTSKMIWHSFDRFSKNAVMIAISSTPYRGQKGYIMDFDIFKKICAKSS